MTCTRTVLGALFVVTPATITVVAAASDTCGTTAELQRCASGFALKNDLKIDVAGCVNQTDVWEFIECLFDTFDGYIEGLNLIEDQFDARLELCEQLGGGAYDPEIDPDEFTTEIDNPYLPFPVDATWTYESETEEGLETIVVTVLDETREIMGVECVTVRDTASIEGELLEDTLDWYAQDLDGNVWYFGEISFNYENGQIVNIDGSWLAGEDGAKPGIVMLADPVPGTTYRQEWLMAEAEDAGTVLDGDVSVTIGIGTFQNCLQTADFTPIDPEALEHKFYAPGIGFIYETKPGETETVELVEYELP